MDCAHSKLVPIGTPKLEMDHIETNPLVVELNPGFADVGMAESPTSSPSPPASPAQPEVVVLNLGPGATVEGATDSRLESTRSESLPQRPDSSTSQRISLGDTSVYPYPPLESQLPWKPPMSEQPPWMHSSFGQVSQNMISPLGSMLDAPPTRQQRSSLAHRVSKAMDTQNPQMGLRSAENVPMQMGQPCLFGAHSVPMARFPHAPENSRSHNAMQRGDVVGNVQCQPLPTRAKPSTETESLLAQPKHSFSQRCPKGPCNEDPIIDVTKPLVSQLEPRPSAGYSDLTHVLTVLSGAGAKTSSGRLVTKLAAVAEESCEDASLVGQEVDSSAADVAVSQAPPALPPPPPEVVPPTSLRFLVSRGSTGGPRVDAAPAHAPKQSGKPVEPPPPPLSVEEMLSPSRALSPSELAVANQVQQVERQDARSKELEETLIRLLQARRQVVEFSPLLNPSGPVVPPPPLLADSDAADCDVDDGNLTRSICGGACSSTAPAENPVMNVGLQPKFCQPPLPPERLRPQGSWATPEASRPWAANTAPEGVRPRESWAPSTCNFPANPAEGDADCVVSPGGCNPTFVEDEAKPDRPGTEPGANLPDWKRRTLEGDWANRKMQYSVSRPTPRAPHRPGFRPARLLPQSKEHPTGPTKNSWPPEFWGFSSSTSGTAPIPAKSGIHNPPKAFAGDRKAVVPKRRQQVPQNYGRRPDELRGRRPAAQQENSTTIIDDDDESIVDYFIRTFKLDLLASTSLRRLEEDEVKHVIASCKTRLTRAPNPSAIVMLAIKNVAARVGRRYHQTEGLRSMLKKPETVVDDDEEDLVGEVNDLQVFGISPSPQAEACEDEEGEDENLEEAVEEVVEAETDPYSADVCGEEGVEELACVAEGDGDEEDLAADAYLGQELGDREESEDVPCAEENAGGDLHDPFVEASTEADADALRSALGMDVDASPEEESAAEWQSGGEEADDGDDDLFFEDSTGAT